MLRLLDLVFSITGLVLGAPVLFAIYVVGLFDTGSPLFRQERVGRDQRPFTLVKFRTMRPDTASVASHLADASAITRLGAFLRRSKLDELPQLWSILMGDMSFVGPRPALFNQYDLIALRTQCGVDALVPGLTGWAQVNGRDALSIPDKVQFDLQYLEKR
jgi:lipopolysaccharide/colanic/teichoic acid biosynthesis glycosyltransferase